MKLIKRVEEREFKIERALVFTEQLELSKGSYKYPGMDEHRV